MLERLPNSDDEGHDVQQIAAGDRIQSDGRTQSSRPYPAVAHSVPSIKFGEASPEKLEIYLSGDDDESEASASSETGPSRAGGRQQRERSPAPTSESQRQRPKPPHRSGTGCIEVVDRTGSHRPPDVAGRQSYIDDTWSPAESQIESAHFARDVRILGWKIVGLRDRLEDLGATGGVREKVGFGAYVGESPSTVRDRR